MLVIRILIIAFVVGYAVWFVNKRILGKNLVLARVIAIALVSTSLIYLLLGIISYLLESV